MENINIPIYRAKKTNTNECVEGFYKNVLYFKNKHIITSLVNISGIENNIQKTNLWDYKNYEIDPTTLAIHFHGMLDSQGNKIFASLSADGKGGDILEWNIFPDDMTKLRINGVPYYSKGGFKVTKRIEMMWHILVPHRECKVVGIQQ